MDPTQGASALQDLSGGNQFPVVILTGLSGAGKSTALNVFEDLGFFSVDGLPSSMVSRLVSLFWAQNPSQYRGIALGMDIRQPDLVTEWQQTVEWLGEHNMHPQVVFLEADQETLLRRYATTRRPHPLESIHSGLETALAKEREILSALRQNAELIIDTSAFSIHDLRRHLQEKWEFLSDTLQGLRLHVISFGYKYGVPKEADLVFDLRFLPNPYFEDQLRHLSGQDAQVSAYVLNGEPGAEFFSKLLDFLTFTLPLYAREGRYRLTLTFGCTGGRHRSVAVAGSVFKRLKELGYQTSLEHRHLELG
ncbi:RNase adapter RapZ [Desulfovermiculus halophilus]|uniref:RNase adapter RapZ n=1 Tax=Desulfovermiculus halophilus TaxID=339722 RepID=UPI0006853A4D|nr:RNase adapter RapZ [Desulfovermiculus halophilus]